MLASQDQTSLFQACVLAQELLWSIDRTQLAVCQDGDSIKQVLSAMQMVGGDDD